MSSTSSKVDAGTVIRRSREGMDRMTGKDRAQLLERVRNAALSPNENRGVTADALADPDNPPADDLVARRGRPRLAAPKQPVKLRLDADVVDALRASGPGWQTRANSMLRKAVGLK